MGAGERQPRAARQGWLLITSRLWYESLGLAALAFLLLCVAYVTPGLRDWVSDVDVLALSWRYHVRGLDVPWPGLRVLGITENTIQAFGDSRVDYPFPRDVHALALRRLADAGAKTIIVDILLSQSRAADSALRDAVRYCRDRGCAIVLAAGIEDIAYASGVASRSLLVPSPVIMEADPVLGISNTQPKLSYKLIEYAAFSLPVAESQHAPTIGPQAVEAYRLYCAQAGRDPEVGLRRACRGTGFFRINYNGPPEEFDGLLYHYEMLFPGLFDGQPRRELSATELETLRHVFAGSAVFIGSRAKADNDYFSTPFGQMFGVDTNAQAFDTLVQERYVYSVPPPAVLLLVLLLSVLAWAAALLRPMLRAVSWAVALACALWLSNLLLFVFWRLELSATMQFAGFGVPFIACALYGGLMEEAAKQKIRGTFSRYVSGPIVEQIIADPSLADLGGAERTVAVMFNDIRNYSTITEKLSPQQIVTMLNCYLGEVTEVIRRHNGFVDKYLGDGLMACFGGPVPTRDPAGDALRASLEMIRALHDKVLPELAAQGLPSFKVGIGLHLGKVVMGNIGSMSRMDYTVIGDAVNVASRVEGQTKEFKWALLATREVLEAAGAQFAAEFLGEGQVKGREQAVAIYRVVDPAAPDLFRL
jgi:adenylate cyclase